LKGTSRENFVFCVFSQNINKYIPVAVPGKIELEKQFTKRPVDKNAPYFLVFGFLGRYRYEIIFQVDVDPYLILTIESENRKILK
jgi:hypothetical protein